MKTVQYIFCLLCVIGLSFSCENDSNEPQGIEDITTVDEAKKVNIAFEATEKSVIKDAGKIQVPIVLEKAAEGDVKLTIGVEHLEGKAKAEEGIDYILNEKVITIKKGETKGFVELEILNNEKVDNDREFQLKVINIYGYGKLKENGEICTITIFSNSFVEFEKNVWTTWEGAMESEEIEQKNSLKIPIAIEGDLLEPAVLTLKIIDGSAQEYKHFEIKTKEINVGTEEKVVYVDLMPIDDIDANSDRTFTIELASVENGNVRLGKSNLRCDVTIVSEEVKRIIKVSKISSNVYDSRQIAPIQVEVDKVCDVPVTVTFGVKNTGTDAVLDEDYIITENSITIKPGLSKAVWEGLTILDDESINESRDVTVEIINFEGPQGITISENEAEHCVVIKNDDFPTFTSEDVSVSEGKSAAIEFSVAPESFERTVHLSYVKGTGISEGTYPATVVVPANASVVSIPFVQGIIAEENPTSYPETNISITGIDNIEFEESVIQEVAMTASPFRSLIGTWEVDVKAYNQGTVRPHKFDITINVDGDFVQKFNHELTCAGQIVAGFNSTWKIHYNVEEEKVYVQNNEPCVRNLNFGGAHGHCDIYMASSTKNFEINKPWAWNINNLTEMTCEGGEVRGMLYKVNTTTPSGGAFWFGLSGGVTLRKK